jgi:hypothetical protein
MKALDSYTLQARFMPVLIVALPGLVLLGGTVASGTRLGIATGAAVTVAATLAGQLGRDRGRQLQPDLWVSWGGSPTVQRMRYCNAKSKERTRRLHEGIEVLLRLRLPVARQEGEDPDSADERYDEAIAGLIGLTRDPKRFPLVAAENINYGQRRNLFGLRTPGIAISAITLVCTAALLFLGSGSLSHRTVLYAPAAGVALLEFLFLLTMVTPNWVRVPAEAYADRLIEATGVLAREASTVQPAARDND